MRVLSVGDIHTKLWIIATVKKIIDNYDHVVFVGDYADDWKSGPLATLETWRALRQLQVNYPEKVSVLIGNHDYIYVNKTRTVSSGYNRMTQMLLDEPLNNDLRMWLNGLPVIEEIDGVTFSHAGITETFNGEYTPMSLWDDNSPIWARPGYEVYKNIPQVFGHTPSSTCYEVQKNIWCIDTFSTYSDGNPVGDETVLEIIDGKEFRKIKMEIKKNDNNNTHGISS